jgi:beta-lactamase regulating signal transducer with metallopeptidase domain
MNLSMTALFPAGLCTRIALTLAHFLWQAALIDLLVTLLAVALREATAATRYWLYLAGLLLMVACPVATWTLLNPPATPAQPAHATFAAGAIHAPARNVAPADFVAPPPPTESVGELHALRALRTALTGIDWSRYAPHAVTAYLLGVSVMLLRVLIGLGGGAKLRRSSTAIDDPLILAALNRAADRIAARVIPPLARCAAVAVPCVIGIFRPVILLPPAVLSGLRPDQIESILAHELAHVKHHDQLVNLLQRLIEALLFFHPSVWRVSRRLRIEREHRCDELVLRAGDSPSAYASSLLRVAELCSTSGWHATPWMALHSQHGLRARIVRILAARSPTDPEMRLSRVWMLAAAMLIGITLSAMWYHRSTTARAALAPATEPAKTQSPPLPALPQTIPDNRIALRVVAPGGDPLPVDDIVSIFVWIQPDMPWLMGPKPKVLDRFEGGWVTVDKSMFALGQPGQRCEMTFSSGGAAVSVSAPFPNDGSRRISFQSPVSPQETGIDLSTGPDNVAPDELAGRVVGPKGTPLVGAIVSFPTKFPPPILQPVKTDADGVFRFPGFAKRHFLYLQIDHDGYAARILTDLAAGKPFTVHMDDTTRLRGELTLPDGSPAADATIEIVTAKPTMRQGIMNPISEITLEAKTDARGHYDIPVEPGEYEMRAISTQPAGYFARHERMEVASGKVVAIPGTLARGVPLKIRALDSITGKPIAGVQFYVSEQRPGQSFPREGANRTTNGDGLAEWDNLMPGKTEICLSALAYARWWRADEEANARSGVERGIDSLSLDLRPGMPEVTVKMEPAMRITGTVITPDGKPVAGADVDIAGLITGDARYAVHTDKDGKFALAFPDLTRAAPTSQPNGQPTGYAIVAHDPQQRFANALSQRFKPRSGQTLVYTINMAPGTRVRGRVIDTQGKPIPKIEVEAEADDDLDRQYYNPRTLTDEQGRFDLPALRPGHYTLYPDTSFGAGIAQTSRSFGKALDVTGEQALNIGDLLYAGAPPGEVPEWYYRLHGNPTTKASTTGPAPATRSSAYFNSFDHLATQPTGAATAAQSTVLLVTEGNFFLEKLLENSWPGHHAVVTPAKYQRDGPGKYSVIIFDCYAPSRLPNAPSIVFNAVPPGGSVRQAKSADGQPQVIHDVTVMDWNRGFPITRNVTFNKMYFSEAMKLECDNVTTLISGSGGPLAVYDTSGFHRVVVIPFDPKQSNWPLQANFPVFMMQTIGFLSTSATPSTRDAN